MSSSALMLISYSTEIYSGNTENQGNTLHFDSQYKGLGSQISVLYCVYRLL